MPTSTSLGREARRDTLEDLRGAISALGEVDLALTLRAEQLPDEETRGILECILRDHIAKAAAELKQLAKELAAPLRPCRHRRPSR
jgi:hypothetical protein